MKVSHFKRKDRDLTYRRVLIVRMQAISRLARFQIRRNKADNPLYSSNEPQS